MFLGVFKLSVALCIIFEVPDRVNVQQFTVLLQKHYAERERQKEWLFKIVTSKKPILEVIECDQVIDERNDQNTCLAQLRDITRILIFKMDHTSNSKEETFVKISQSLRELISVVQRIFSDKLDNHAIDWNSLIELADFLCELKNSTARWNTFAEDVDNNCLVKESCAIVASLVHTSDVSQRNIYWQHFEKSIVKDITQKLSRLTSKSTDKRITKMVETVVLSSILRVQCVVQSTDFSSPSKIIKQGEIAAQLWFVLSTLKAFGQPFLENASAMRLKHKVDELTSAIHEDEMPRLKNVILHKAGYLYLLHLIKTRLALVSLK